MDWLRDHPWETWLIASGLLAATELLTLDLVLLMLSGGALVGFVVAIVGGPFALQLVLALATSVSMLFLLRPALLKRLHGGPSLRTGTDALLGQRATVLAELAGDSPGRIKLGGEEWRALPYDESDRIPPGTMVEVVQVTGATAYVLRLPSIES